MRRAGIVLFAAVPVALTAGAFSVVPTDSAESPAEPTVATAQHAARQEAKSRAEQEGRRTTG